jgi:hypothetical protein
MTTKRDIHALISFLRDEFITKSTNVPRLLGVSQDVPLREKYPYLLRTASENGNVVS